MIFNIIVKEQKYLEECLYVEFQPEPYKYRDKYLCGYCIYNLEDVDSSINQKKEEIKKIWYNEICSYDSDFASKYTL